MDQNLTLHLQGLVRNMAIDNKEKSCKELSYLLFNPLFRLALAMVKSNPTCESSGRAESFSAYGLGTLFAFRLYQKSN